jgi:exopolysaccharide biosynthesis polyprenyl glycosylphosphotransferase
MNRARTILTDGVAVADRAESVSIAEPHMNGTAGLPAAAGPVEASTTWGESAASASQYSVPRRFLWATDVLVQGVAVMAAWRLSPLVPTLPASGPGRYSEIFWVPFVMIPAALLTFQVLGGYRPLLEQSRTRLILGSAAAALAGISLVSLVLVAAGNQQISRSFIFALALLCASGLLAHRAAIRFYKNLRLKAGAYARNVVVVASPQVCRRLASHFARSVSPSLYRLVGHLETQADGSGPPMPPSPDVPTTGGLGTVNELGDLLVHRPIHDVVAVVAGGPEPWLRTVVEQCEFFRVTLRLVPEALIERPPHDLEMMAHGDPLRLPTVVLRPHQVESEALFAKRVLDIAISGVLLVLLAPLFLLIAVAIKLTSPELPVFYPWRVVGYRGRPFTGYKFTTMIADAERRQVDLEHLNEMSGPVFKIKADPRITPLGRFLRKYSLNELPQLWSVLKGDMSLVGPRPAYPNELARYELWHKRKLCVQPGITCLWQIRGRNRISNFDDWVQMDFEYIDHWSLWLDVKILVRTLGVVVTGSGS